MQTVGLVVLALALMAFVGLVIARQSNEGGRWGIGKLRTVCPRCGTRLPMIRKPASEQEALWGGWTCPSCGCKIDRYGKAREA